MGLKNNLKKLRAKSEEYTIPDTDITLELRGLSFNELADLAEFGDRKDSKGALNYVLYSAIRRAVPKEDVKNDAGEVIEEGATDEEVQELIASIDSQIANKIIKKVQDLSGIEEPEKN